ncbi:MAG: hypothetical protein JO039_12825 [Solirubrobacterales bacterium]|nr:hypothetical protein [Solirubrobacterales bacterium]
MAARRHWSSVQGTRRLLLRLRGRVGIGAGEMPAIHETRSLGAYASGCPSLRGMSAWLDGTVIAGHPAG